MGFGKHRKVSTLSKRISSTDFQTTSVEPVTVVTPDEKLNSGATPIDKTELKRRRSSGRRSIYSIGTDFDSDTADDDKPVPPDGGYGWVIVVAVHFIQAMGVGFLTSLGIFYIEWRKYFDSNAAETGLVVSLSSVVMGVISPMAVGIAGKVGSRPLVMSGAIVVFLGLLGTSFANSIMQLMFTVGVVSAFGYGLICSPAILVLADYFENNIALATGIAFSGVSIGQLIFPPLTVEFLYLFGGWKTTMFIFSALVLNIAVFGALLRPIKKVKQSTDKKQLKSKTSPTTYENAGFQEDVNYIDSIPSTSCDNHMDKEIARPLEFQNELPILNMISYDKWALPHLDSHPQPDDSFRNSPIQRYGKKIRDVLMQLVKFMAKSYGIPGVFKSPLFLIMIPAIICNGIGWYATVTHQAARAMSTGISEEDASFLLSLMGIGSLVGRVTHGWFIDRGYITSEMCLVLVLAVCSASTFLICFVNLFPILAILATVQGMTAGISNTLVTVIIKTFAKPNFEEAAVGMLFLIWGIGDLLGGVMAGYLYDATGDYNVAFYFAGSAFAVTTVLVYITCVLKDRIVARLYANLELRQMEKGGESTDRLEEMDTNAEGFDNVMFEMENEEELNDSKDTGSCADEHITLNTRPVFQIEVHDSWDRASSLKDTVV